MSNGAISPTLARFTEAASPFSDSAVTETAVEINVSDEPQTDRPLVVTAAEAVTVEQKTDKPAKSRKSVPKASPKTTRAQKQPPKKLPTKGGSKTTKNAKDTAVPKKTNSPRSKPTSKKTTKIAKPTKPTAKPAAKKNSARPPKSTDVKAASAQPSGRYASSIRQLEKELEGHRAMLAKTEAALATLRELSAR